MAIIQRWIIEFLADAGFVEILFFWLILLFLTFLCIYAIVRSFKALRNGKSLDTLEIFGLIALIPMTIVWIAVIPIIGLVFQITFGAFKGFLWAIVICLVALPISLIGYNLRRYFICVNREYRGPQRRNSILYAVIGLAIISVLGYYIYEYSSRLGLVAAILSGALIILGFFGVFLIPVEIPDEREPLEAPQR